MALRDNRSWIRFVGNECDESAELLPHLSKIERTRTIHWIEDKGGHRQGARAIFTGLFNAGGIFFDRSVDRRAVPSGVWRADGIEQAGDEWRLYYLIPIARCDRRLGAG